MHVTESLPQRKPLTNMADVISCALLLFGVQEHSHITFEPVSSAWMRCGVALVGRPT